LGERLGRSVRLEVPTIESVFLLRRQAQADRSAFNLRRAKAIAAGKAGDLPDCCLYLLKVLGAPWQEEGAVKRLAMFNSVIWVSKAMNTYNGLQVAEAGTRQALHGRARVGGLCLLALALLMWGPQRLRLDTRDPSIALDNSFDLDWQGAMQIVVVGAGATLLAYGLVSASRGNSRQWIKISGWPVRWYCALSVLALCSSGWSVRAGYTAFFSIKLLVCWALPWILLSSFGLRSIEHVLRCVKVVSVCQVIGLLVCAIVARDSVGSDIKNVGYRLTGLPLVIDFGNSAALWLIFLVAEALDPTRRGRRSIQLLSLALIVCNLYLARTRSLWIGIAVALLCVLLVYRRQRRVVLGVVFAALMSGLLLLTASGISDHLIGYFLRGQSDNEFASGSGRVQAFDFLLDVWRQNPIFGGGYAAGSRLNLVTFMQTTGLGIGAGHDVISRTLVDLGAVGLIVVVMLYASTASCVALVLRSYWELAQRRQVAIASGIVVLALTSALTSSGLMDADAKLATAVLVLLKMQADRAKKRQISLVRPRPSLRRSQIALQTRMPS
jgi:hypothetical protein